MTVDEKEATAVVVESTTDSKISKDEEDPDKNKEVAPSKEIVAVVSESELDDDDKGEEGKVCKEGEGEDREESSFLHNLCVLPPLQRKYDDSDNELSVASDAVLLPPIQASEPVNSIRAALSEVRGYAHLTNFRLVAENLQEELLYEIVNKSASVKGKMLAPSSSSATGTNRHVSASLKKKKKKTKGNNNNHNLNHNEHLSAHNVVSSYTLKNAVVKVPASYLSLELDPTMPSSDIDGHQEEDEPILDDYGDLSPLVSSGLIESNKTGFRIVLEQYNVGSIKDHVKRVRALLEGNIPLVDSLTNGKDDQTNHTTSDDSNKDGAGVEGISKEEGSSKKEDNHVNKGDISKEKEVKSRKKDADSQQTDVILPGFTLNQSIAIDGTNLQDFFYLACGEEEQLNFINGVKMNDEETEEGDSSKNHTNSKNNEQNALRLAKDEALKLNELERRCCIKCPIAYSAFNPPPSSRRLHGDLAYLEVTLPDNEGVVHVTAIPLGFYINRTTERSFDPSPAIQPCFSHALLDCILLKSDALRAAWIDAQLASQERAELSTSPGSMENPLKGLFQAAVKGDYCGEDISTILGQNTIDSVTLRPSWIVPVPRKIGDEGLEQPSLKPGLGHAFDAARAEEEMSNYFGLDLTGGVARDWNEELQTAREMPVDSLEQRIDRARFVQKTLNEFGDASVAGARAIFDGHITPMNPNEPARSHVYLHNNIFFSRAVDAGVDTFKIAQGDKCARKSAIRDAQCVGTLHRLDISGLCTLATVLIDYLGTRLVCQSIVPGILQGEKTHTIIYGAVEATSPLAWDKDFHASLEDNLGKGLMIAARKIPTLPLTEERMKFVESMRTMPPPLPAKDQANNEEQNELTTICGAVEMKGIKGSDQRSYCLDLARLTPRDANWLPKIDGGTGCWESILNTGNKD